jgi:hypothetical protein
MSKQDQNAGEVVSALRRAGCFVRFIEFAHGIRGCPDLLVAHGGLTYLMEVKGPRGRLSEAQEKLHAEWHGGPLVTVRTPEEALAAIGLEVVDAVNR